MSHNIGLHHFHKRKRIYKNYEPYPHPHKWKRLMDKLIYVAIGIKLIMTLPQVMNIWLLKNISGVSAYTWATYSVVTLFWISYGILHREKPIIISSVMLFALEITIATGAILHGFL